VDLFVRMLFSTLIDADRLSTEKHFDPAIYELRARRTSACELSPSLNSYIEGKRDTSTTLNRIRNEVYECCLAAAQLPPGMFRLTVPTGGGKTLSSLAFALAHLSDTDTDGIVVVALPYTSIIEQTAEEYRKVPGIGAGNVLEHHSAVSASESEGQDEDTIRLQPATDNWDSPIVVTTTVQILESLFSDRPSKVRKLHRLAGSVIILDEFQALPPGLLVPTMDMLRLLTTPVSDGGYGATVVLCTATQPGFDSPKLRSVLKDVSIREIIPHHAEHFAKLKRVKYDWRTTPISWNALADELRGLPSALSILNTRKDALALLDSLKGTNDLFHLSTLLCGAHRRCVLDTVRRRLDAGLPVVLVSTQVVECGVDFDFPYVYRAIGPLDRVVQAAGRCNRNFSVDVGQVVIFEPESGSSPMGPYRDATNMTRFLMNGRDSAELHTPSLYQTFFRRLFNDLDLDKRRIQTLRKELNFPEVASAYRLIDESTLPVVVKYGEEWQQPLSDFRQRPSHKTWRGLQPFIVNLFDHDLRRSQDGLEEVADNLKLWHGPYDELRGIGLGSAAWDPSDLYVGGS
jgi:CRISPR-associated endonuclease/helicase Cas3